MMLTQLNPGLQAALNAAAVLEKEANPIAPGPGGMPIKSISGGLMDAVQQKATAAQDMQMPQAPQAPQEQGIQGILSNMRNAAPMLAQQQQDAQANQIADLAAQKLQGQGGGGSFPFKEGGIVGFAGEGPSYVGQEFGGSTPEALAADALRVEENKKRRRMEELQAQLEFLAQAGAPQAAQTRAQLAALQGPAPAPIPDLEGRREARPAPSAQDMAARPPAPPSAMGAPSGGGGLGGLDLKSIMAIARSATGDNPDVERARAAAAEYEAALKGQPVPGGASMEALQKAQARRAALYAEAEKDLPMRRYRALLSGIHRGGLGGGAEAVTAADEARMREVAAQIAEQEVAGLKMAAIKDMQDGFRVGNLAKALEAREKLAQIANQERNIFSKAFGDVLTAFTTMRGQNMSAETARQSGIARLMASLARGGGKQPSLSAKDAIAVQDMVKSKFFSPMAVQDPDFNAYIRRLPGGDAFLIDVSKGRAGLDPKNPSGLWGAATPLVQQAAKNYERDFLRRVGPTEQAAAGAPSADDVLAELGG